MQPLLTLMLALDLTTIKAERSWKRSELALKFADSALDAAAMRTRKAIWRQASRARRSRNWVQLSYDSLVATVRIPATLRPFKRAEKATRRFYAPESLSDLMSAFDRGAVEPVHSRFPIFMTS